MLWYNALIEVKLSQYHENKLNKSLSRQFKFEVQFGNEIYSSILFP